jgi:hypothetical protein
VDLDSDVEFTYLKSKRGNAVARRGPAAGGEQPWEEALNETE